MLKLLIVVLLLNSGKLGAQCDPVYIRIQRDSALKAHLARPTGVTLYQRRAIARLDTIIQTLCSRPPEGTTTVPLWPRQQGTFPAGADSIIVCAAVQRSNVMHIGSSTVTVRFVASNAPLIIGTPIARSTTELQALCRPGWAYWSEALRQGMAWGPLANAPLIAVKWTLHNVQLTPNDTARTIIPIPSPDIP